MNRYLKKIKSIDDEKKLKRYTYDRIRRLTAMAKEYNTELDTIGSNIDINPKYNLLYYEQYGRCNWWLYFIPKGKRIVYKTITLLKNDVSFCGGCFYYMDDFTYLYDFVKYVKDKDINSLSDFIETVHIFMRNNMGAILNTLDRDTIHSLLLKGNDSYYDPIKKHSIKDFYNTGAAQCTEYGAVAQNLMSFFGLDTLYVLDLHHAYNIIHHNEKYYILDYSNIVGVYDINFEFIKTLPFFVEIENFDDDEMVKFFSKYGTLYANDYNYIDLNGSLREYYYDKEREYGCGKARKIDNKKIYLPGEEENDRERRIILNEDELEDKGKSIVLTLEK